MSAARNEEAIAALGARRAKMKKSLKIKALFKVRRDAALRAAKTFPRSLTVIDAIVRAAPQALSPSTIIASCDIAMRQRVQ